MAYNYADVLESYIIDDIATEGIGDTIKKLGKSALDAIMKIIRAIKEKIMNLVLKIKNAKIYDQREIEETLRENLRETEKRQAAQDEVAALKESLKLTNRITVYITSINKSVITLAREIPALDKYISNPKNVDDALDDLDFSNLRPIKPGDLEALNKLLSDVEERSTNGKIYASMNMKRAALNCSESVIQVMNAMEIRVKKLQGLNSDDEEIRQCINKLTKFCQDGVSRTNSVVTILAKIINANFIYID